MRDLDLVTVCEEAGCPNIYECWSEGTATFMINGDRCTRACGFCLVDTRHPSAGRPARAARVAEAYCRMGLAHAVVTAVARDDLGDGGASGFAAHRLCDQGPLSRDVGRAAHPRLQRRSHSRSTRSSRPGPRFSTTTSKPSPGLQRAVRPSAGYARSLSVLARATRQAS